MLECVETGNDFLIRVLTLTCGHLVSRGDVCAGRLLLDQSDTRRTDAPFLGSEKIVGRRRKQKHRPDAPDQATGPGAFGEKNMLWVMSPNPNGSPGK